jgi:TonB family protein
VNFWRDNPVFRGIVYTLSAVALIEFFVMRNHNAPHAAPDNDRIAVAAATPRATEPVAPRHANTMEILARCQPGIRDFPSVPNFVVGENFNRAGVQLKLRFVVDNNGFVTNAYVTGATVVSSTDQEAALEYVRHLSFEAPTEEECQTIKMQMVAKFHMALDSSGDWTTIFDVHPVYSFNGDRVVVNPN